MIRRIENIPMQECCPMSDGSLSGQCGAAFPPFSSLLGNAGISWCSPCPEIAGPFIFIWYVGSDDGQIVLLMSAYDMDWAARFSASKHEAAVASDVIRVIFNDLATLNHLTNFCGADHAFRPVHLPKRMRQKKILSLRGFTNLQKEASIAVHGGRLHSGRMHFNSRTGKAEQEKCRAGFALHARGNYATLFEVGRALQS